MEGFAEPLVTVATPAEADAVLVVDVSNAAWRAHHAHSTLTWGGKPSGHIFGTFQLLLGVLRHQLGPGKWSIVFCYDGPGAKEERRKLVPSYKLKRDPTLVNPCPDVLAALAAVPGMHVLAEGREGDDAIAWAAQRITKPVVVYTGDRDLWALMRHPHVRVWSPNMRRFVGPQDVLEEYHVDPSRVALAKALFGDASDNIKGVERLQRKLVAPVLNLPQVGDVASLYEGFAGPAGSHLTLTTRAKIVAARAVVEANYAIILPKLDGFGPATCRIQRNTPEAKAETLRILGSYGCESLLGQIDVFYGAPTYVQTPVEEPDDDLDR